MLRQHIKVTLRKILEILDEFTIDVKTSQVNSIPKGSTNVFLFSFILHFTSPNPIQS